MKLEADFEKFFTYTNPLFWLFVVMIGISVYPYRFYKWIGIPDIIFYHFKIEKQKSFTLKQLIKVNEAHQSQKKLSKLKLMYWQKSSGRAEEILKQRCWDKKK